MPARRRHPEYLLTSCGVSPGQKEDAGWRIDVKLLSEVSAETADLKVTGGSGDPFFLSVAAIRKLPSVTFETYDPWDEKRERFTGVPLYALLNWLGLAREADHIPVVAGNGYESLIKVSDLQRYEYILAYMIDGEYRGETQALTKKGRLVIAINFDKHADISVDVYKNHLVWQVIEIVSSRD